MESYGVGLSNLTNKDKGKLGKITQKNAFTIILLNPEAKDYQANSFVLDKSENLIVSGFTMFCLSEKYYKRLSRMTTRLAKEQAKEALEKSCEGLGNKRL